MTITSPKKCRPVMIQMLNYYQGDVWFIAVWGKVVSRDMTDSRSKLGRNSIHIQVTVRRAHAAICHNIFILFACIFNFCNFLNFS